MSRSDGASADYYVLPEGATQLQDLISHRDMNSQIGEIFRACYRYGIVSHSDKMRDAKKIRFYAQAEVERLEKLIQSEQTSHVISDIPEDDHTWPSWKTLDKKWNYCAQDKCGKWGLFSKIPVPNEVLGYWVCQELGTSYMPLFKGTIKEDWRNTLQARTAQ